MMGHPRRHPNWVSHYRASYQARHRARLILAFAGMACSFLTGAGLAAAVMLVW